MHCRRSCDVMSHAPLENVTVFSLDRRDHRHGRDRDHGDHHGRVGHRDLPENVSLCGHQICHQRT